MARPKGEQIDVRINDSGVVEGRRKFLIEVEASAPSFILADALSTAGAFKPISQHLKKEISQAVATYLASSKSFVREASSALLTSSRG